MAAAHKLAFLWFGRDFVRFLQRGGCIDFNETLFHCVDIREKIKGLI